MTPVGVSAILAGVEAPPLDRDRRHRPHVAVPLDGHAILTCRQSGHDEPAGIIGAGEGGRCVHPLRGDHEDAGSRDRLRGATARDGAFNADGLVGGLGGGLDSHLAAAPAAAGACSSTTKGSSHDGHGATSDTRCRPAGSTCTAMPACSKRRSTSGFCHLRERRLPTAACTAWLDPVEPDATVGITRCGAEQPQ